MMNETTRSKITNQAGQGRYTPCRGREATVRQFFQQGLKGRHPRSFECVGLSGLEDVGPRLEPAAKAAGRGCVGPVGPLAKHNIVMTTRATGLIPNGRCSAASRGKLSKSPEFLILLFEGESLFVEANCHAVGKRQLLFVGLAVVDTILGEGVEAVTSPDDSSIDVAPSKPQRSFEFERGVWVIPVQDSEGG